MIPRKRAGNPRRYNALADGDLIDRTQKDPPSADGIEGLTFTEHLEELRNRLLYSILFLILGCIVSFIFTRSYIFPWLVSPWKAVSADATLQVLGPTEKFMAYFKVGFAAGLVIALPFIIYQAWLFVRPGLTRHEIKWVRGLMIAAFLLFLAGCAFCFYLIFPIALRFLLEFEPGNNLATKITTQITLDRYFSFVVLLTLAGGFVFQIPLVSLFLSMLGIVSPAQLAKFRRYALLGAVVLAAALTPTGDPVTLSLLGVPIYLLYEASIIVSRFVYKKRDSAAQNVTDKSVP